MEVLHEVPYFLLTPIIALIMAITTEFSSNSATTTLFLPLLAKVAISIAWHPLLFMIPATFACSFAFMLPMATPPNAIAHSTGYLKSADMLIPCLILKAAGIVLLTILTPTLSKKLFPFFFKNNLQDNFCTSICAKFNELLLMLMHSPFSIGAAAEQPIFVDLISRPCLFCKT
jgi:hypothetical protein